MALHKKAVYARVSSPDGTFLKAWPDIDFRGYSKTLNGGVGECVFGLPVPFDYDGAELREGNDVEVILRDADTISDTTSEFGVRTIYKGYISLIERDVDGASETVTVHLLGYYTLLAIDVLRIGSYTTVFTDGIDLTATEDIEPSDVGAMVRKTIDLFNTNHGAGKLFYEPGDIEDTGNTVTYGFYQKTYREALDLLKGLAPADVYWYIDETGRVQFKERPTAPTHTFIFNRHISKIHVERSVEKVRNVALIWNGIRTGAENADPIYKSYEDDASIALYDRRVERITDYGIFDTDSANAMGAKFLAENKEASTKVIATIIDNNSEDGTNTSTVETLGDDLIYNGGFTGTAFGWQVGDGWAYNSNNVIYAPFSADVIDSYDQSNVDTFVTVSGSSGQSAIAQTFTGDGNIVAFARFRVTGFPSDSGNITAKIYAITGSFGSTSKPTGSALATSDSIDVLTLGYATVTFTFSGINQITLTNGTDYALVLEYTGSNTGVNVGFDNSSPSHAGNAAVFNGSSWTAISVWDFSFYVYTTGATLQPAGTLYQDFGGDDGTEYRVTVDVGGSVGSVLVSLGTGDSQTFAAGSGSQSFSGTYASSSNGVIITPSSDFNGTIDNVSVRQLGSRDIVQRTGTDIESIQPGDTCRFVNFSPDMSDIFRDNMLITAVNYTLDSAEITVELIKSGLTDIQAKHGVQIRDITNGGNDGGFGIPAAYS